MEKLPATETFPSLPTETRVTILDTLFEPSTGLHTLSLPVFSTTPTYESYDTFIEAIGAQLAALLESSSTSDTEWLDNILASHPRLGAKKVESQLSAGEQAQLQAGDEDGSEAKELAQLNAEYEHAFAGLRYVVFVNGRPRAEIKTDMRARIQRGDLAAERAAAVMVSLVILVTLCAMIMVTRIIAFT